jgi:hypothetical protein
MKKANEKVSRFMSGSGYGIVWLNCNTMGLRTHSAWTNNLTRIMITRLNEERLEHALRSFTASFGLAWL